MMPDLLADLLGEASVPEQAVFSEPAHLVFPAPRVRRRRYRFVVDVEVDAHQLRHGVNPKAWPAPIIRAWLYTALRTMPGYCRGAVTWRMEQAGQTREVLR